MSADKVSTYGIDGMNFEIVPFGSYNNSFLSLKNFDEVEYAKIEPKGNGFMLSICLPRTVRNDNMIPFGLDDVDTIGEINTEIIEALNEVFFDGYDSKLVHVEICGTCETVGECKCDNIFRLLTNSLLHGTEQNKLFIIKDKEKEILPYCTGMQSRTIRNRWSLKAYDKYREMGILSERELVRLEFCLKSRQINSTLHNNTDISSVLTEPALVSLIGLYRVLFDELTEDFVEPYLNRAKAVIRETFIENNYKPKVTFLECKEIFADEVLARSLFREADQIKGLDDNSRQTIYRLRQENDWPRDTLKTIKKLHYLDDM